MRSSFVMNESNDTKGSKKEKEIDFRTGRDNSLLEEEEDVDVLTVLAAAAVAADAILQSNLKALRGKQYLVKNLFLMK